MAALSSVDYSAGVLGVGTTGTVMTLNALAAAAGTPAAQAVTVQNSSLPFAVTVSSLSGVQTVAVSSITGGTITSLTSGTVNVSGGTIVVSSITAGSIVVTNVATISSGTLASLSSGTVAIANGANVAAVKATLTAPTSADPALVVAISPNSGLSLGTVAVSSVTGGTIAVSSIAGGTITTVGSISSGTLASISSGTFAIGNAGTIAAVKASVTAPSSTDPALVVALSPNGLNPNGTAVSSNSAPTTAASDQSVIGVALDTTRLSNGTAGSSLALTPTFLSFGAASAGNTTLVSSQASKKIRVLEFSLTATATLDVQFLSGAPSSANLSGPLHANGNGWGIVKNFSPVGLFQSNSSEGLVLNLSAASSVGGSLVYVLV